MGAKYVFFISLFSFLSVFSQDDTRALSITKDFQGIAVLNGIHLSIQKGDTTKLEVSGYRANDVIATVIDNYLQIQLTTRRKKDEEGITNAILTYKDSLSSIEVREGAKAHAEYPIVSTEINLYAFGASSMDINVECDRLNVSLAGKSEAVLAGDTIFQNVEAKGKSTYKALNLTCEQAIVLAKSASQVHLEVSELIDAKATFSGSVVIYNEPKVLNQKSSFGGTIIKVEE